MAKTMVDLVEEAINLIEKGQLSLDHAPVHYGSEWDAIAPEVELALRINQAAHPPLISTRPFVALDKSAGWASLKTQLEAARPVAVPTPVASKATKAIATGFNWQEWLRLLTGPRVRQVGSYALMTLVFFTTLTFVVNQAVPGDWLYRAKLGLDHIGEITSFSANDRALASLNYADRRLAEIENLANNGRPEQLSEAQAQYLRGLDLSLYYSNNDKFSSYVAMYDHLNEQRDRVFRLQQFNYVAGQRNLQPAYLLNRLDAGVYILAPKVPGNSPVLPPTVPPLTPDTSLTPVPTSR